MTYIDSGPRWLRVASLLGFLLVSTASAQDVSVKPGINDHFKNPELEVDAWAERFETESREVFLHREAIVGAVGVKSGWTVADVGAGTGLFSMLFADAVGPEGKVLAVDIAEPFLATIRERARREKHTNVETILGTDKDTHLPPAAVDVVFVCDTYHHFEYPQETLASLRRALRPGGLLVVVDFERLPGKSSDWVMTHVRAGKEIVLQEIAAAGFERLDEAKFLTENYLVRFRNPDR